MSLLEKAQMFTKGAENARAEGDTKASIEMAIIAAQLLQLHELLTRKI